MKNNRGLKICKNARYARVFPRGGGATGQVPGAEDGTLEPRRRPFGLSRRSDVRWDVSSFGLTPAPLSGSVGL